MASANLFDDGDEVSSLSESLLSKSVRIVGGEEVSIVHSSPICKTRSAHIACAYAVESAGRIDLRQALILHEIIPSTPYAGARGQIPLLSFYD